MIPKFRIFDKKKKRFLDDFTMEIDRYGISVLDEFNYVVDEDDRVLMQSTGLNDMNVKEIFEGDIVKYWENIGYIEFYQGSWVINWNDGSLFDLYDNENNLEVLGNIHEHSHLLGNGGQQQ
ncbi:YopX family protein [Macrococcoides caseolyticum]|uniref:YopX family protein n=1 Tax=Macrococcoides caseolyticum TaxID=69966 RepID=UPI0012FEE5CE|nr:YopX family protein [Macrococcus caseolyticus]